MKTWTTQAERRLAEYLDERVRREGFSGEEADELKSDLRCHVHEEAERDAAETIGLMNLEGILGRLDSGYRPPVAPPSQLNRFYHGFKSIAAWSFGVGLPFGVIVFESLVTFCGGVFFDPIPTFWHLILVLTVPLVNGWLLLGGKGLSTRGRGALAGFALVISLFYGLLFLPLLPASIIAIILIGMGLLSLAPVLAAWVTWRIGRRAGAEHPEIFRPARRWGAVAAILALVVLEGPSVWTRANLEVALKGDNPSAIARLRSFHSERSLLRVCYEGSRGTRMGTDIAGWLSRGWLVSLEMFGNRRARTLDSEKAREVFFRVTGKPFNSIKPPQMTRLGARGGFGEEIQQLDFDAHTGGDQVAVRLKQLDLSESRFDGHLDAESRTGYGEWTMVFYNGSAGQREARCQVKLPRNGRVSRLTLWVNGEPREAAFSTVSAVKAAYRQVVMVERRDPVLVTSCGPDSVMVQCFPVPANGEMKIRIGITAPVENGRWELPQIVEQNFGLKKDLEFSVWLQGDRAFSLVGAGSPHPSVSDGPGRSLSASVASGREGFPRMAVDVPGLEGIAPPVWCEDSHAEAAGKFLSRETRLAEKTPMGKPVIVIDGSRSLDSAREWMLAVLKARFPTGECTLLLADDTARRVTFAELEDYRFTGGRDNEPALREAIRLAKEQPEATPIIWLHGPQAVKLARPEGLLQLLERGSRRPLIYSIDAVPGPNRLTEEIYRSGVVRSGPALIDPGQNFADFMALILSGQPESKWEWRRASSPDGFEGKKVWDHLARTWAIESAETAVGNPDERSKLAARYQLVTPVSGAVVLETAAQYESAGLTPVDPNAVPHIPSVPEPSSILLLMVAGSAALLHRRRAA